MTLFDLAPGQRFHLPGRETVYMVVKVNGLASFDHTIMGLVCVVDVETGELIADSGGRLVEPIGRRHGDVG